MTRKQCYTNDFIIIIIKQCFSARELSPLQCYQVSAESVWWVDRQNSLESGMSVNDVLVHGSQVCTVSTELQSASYRWHKTIIIKVWLLSSSYRWHTTVINVLIIVIVVQIMLYKHRSHVKKHLCHSTHSDIHILLQQQLPLPSSSPGCRGAVLNCWWQAAKSDSRAIWWVQLSSQNNRRKMINITCGLQSPVVHDYRYSNYYYSTTTTTTTTASTIINTTTTTTTSIWHTCM